eukprot:Gb_36311 [translate_table: standard]
MAASGCLSAQANSFSSYHANATLLSNFKSIPWKLNPGQRICISVRKKLPCKTGTISNCPSEETATAVSSITRAVSTESDKSSAYQVASVTWSVAHGFKEKHDPHSLVFAYLKDLGIVTDELEDLELTTVVDVMKERVEFLQKLGLSIDDINEYPLVLGCSVRRNMIPVLDYLEKLGVRKSALPDLLRIYPQVLHASVVIDLAPIVKFLQGLDIKANDIPRVIENYPEILGFKLEGTMSTSVAYLVSIGVNRRGIGAMLTQYPQILATRVGTVIKPIVDYLGNLGLQKQVLARLIEKRPYILGFSLQEQMKENVESLLSFGVKQEGLASIIAQYPEILGLELKPKLISQKEFFSDSLKVGHEDFGKVLEKMPQVVSLTQDPVLKRVEFLRECGFSAEDVTKMVVTCPQLVAFNLDVMKRSFNFFKNIMKGALQELVDFPAYFTYSLESRIKPRFRRLSSKGIKCSLAWFLNCSDERFEERMDAEYIEIDEMEPSMSMGRPLESAVDERYSEEEDEESENDEETEDDEESEDELFYGHSLSV